MVGPYRVQDAAPEGGKVAGGDIDKEGLAALAADLGPDVFAAMPCDVTAEDDVTALTELAGTRFGRLDTVVANAGGSTASEITDYDFDDWRRTVDLCLHGAFLTVKHAFFISGGLHSVDGGARTRHYPGVIAAIERLQAEQPSQ